MYGSEENSGIALAFLIVCVCISAFGFIWVIDTSLTYLPEAFAIVALMSYGMGLVIVISLGMLYISDQSPFPIRKVNIRDLQGAVTFLDMLSHSLTQFGSIDYSSAPDYVNPLVPDVRRSTTGLLMRLNSSFAKKWAKTVEKEAMYLKLIIEIPTMAYLGLVQSGQFLEVIVFGGIIFVGFMATTSAEIGLMTIGILILIGGVFYVIRRIYIIKQRKIIESLDMHTESAKGLQMIFDLAEKRAKKEFILYVLGDYDNLSYTGETTTTSDGHILKQAILNPGGK